MVLSSPRNILLTCLAFIALLCLALLQNQIMVLLLPVLLAIILLAFFRPDYLIFIIVFLTPFSLNLEELDLGGSALYLPTEPLLFGLSILLVLGHFYQKIFPVEVMRHPVTRLINLYLIWLLVTSLTSVQPVVSLKYLISKLWYIIPLYYGGVTLFLQVKNIRRYLLVYLIPFGIIIVYTLINHASYGFEEDPAHWVMEPFYRDHTQYGAVLAIFVPIAFGFLIERGKSFWWYLLFFLLFTLTAVGLLYTYSRAAWLSIFVVFGILILVWLRIRVWVILMSGILIAGFILFSLDDIVVRLEKNKTDSAENLVENVESITNITTDASNLERINRWKAVFAMTKVKPVFGWGPGTYMFEYAPFQQSEDLTIISTNFGDVGNAHSEYLGPMAESGIPGFLTVVFWIFAVFLTAVKAYRRLNIPVLKHLILFISLGLATYFIHGFLNNFLDSDKASVPVFGTMAAIVAIDIISKKRSLINKSSLKNRNK